jgi:GNAT superfamily N-acetyltransferase
MADGKESLRVRDMKLSDLDGVVELHRYCFTSEVSIFSALSPGVLKRYYAMFVEEPESYAAVLEEPASGRIVGFTFGTSKPGIRKRFLRRYYCRFFWSVIKGLFTDKSVWKSLWLRLWGKSSLNLGEYNPVLAVAGVPPPQGPEDLCMGIGVHSDYRGGGNAARLIDYYVTRVFEKGAVRIRGAVLTSNIASMTFFRRCGWNFKRISDAQVSIWIDRPEEGSKILK